MEQSSCVMEKPVVINGYLYCRKIGRDWKKRWCEIKNNKLYFYSSPPTVNAKSETGFIRLEDTIDILDSPKTAYPKIVEGEQKSEQLLNCTFEMTFQQKSATIFFCSTSEVNKEKWIHSLLYSKYFYINRAKIKQLFCDGLSWNLLLHGGSEPIGRRGFAISRLINCSDILRYNKSSNPNLRMNQPNFSVWMFGGINSSNDILSDFWELHFPNIAMENNCIWIKHQIKGQPSARSGHTINEYGKVLVLFGGKTDSGRSNELFFFDTVTLEWSMPNVTGSIPSQRDAHSAVIVADNLFVYGGRNDSTIFNDLYIFNLKTMRWSKREQKENYSLTPLCHHSCIAITNSILLFFGGYDGSPSNRIFIYNIKQDLWTQATAKGALPPPRFLHSTVYIDNQMIIYGGTNGDTIFSDMYYFMPETMYWHQIVYSGVNLPSKRYGHKMIASEKFSFIFGGNNGENTYPNDLFSISPKPMDMQWHERMAIGLGDQACYRCDLKISEENSSQLVHLIHPQYVFHEQCFHELISELRDDNIMNIFRLRPKQIEPKSDISYLLNYVRFMTKQNDHPFSLLIHKYILEFNAQYVNQYVDPSLLLQKALDDIHSFLSNFTELVISNLKLLDCPEGKLHICIIVKKMILPKIFNSLFAIYLKANVFDDSRFTSLISKLQNITTKELHVNNNSLIEYEEATGDAYSHCISVFGRLIECSDPYQKLDTLVSVLHLAHFSISEFFVNQTKKKDVFITADDLVPLFQYFLIKSKISYIYSEMAFIQDFLDASLLNGEAAYCLTTLQVAVSATERTFPLDKEN